MALLGRTEWLLINLFFMTQLMVAAAGAPDFNRDIAPLIAKRCLECHNERDIKGEVNLTTHEGFTKGTKNGRLLLDLVTQGEMPPKQKGLSQKLPDDEIRLLEEWVESGAAWPSDRVLDLYEATSDVRAGRDWWSLQPVKRPAVPQLTGHPVDAFVRAKLKKVTMTPAKRASRRALARRVYFDLTGLPPSPGEMEQFLADTAPGAWPRLIDRLLASPRYGERWSRHWLDLVRFAETDGYERDKLKPNICRYRDWVINALNDDMPYPRFVAEQLAGDEIGNRTEQSVIATGLIRAGTWNDEPNDPADYLYTRLEDMVHTTTTAFLGLTVKCARCHDHKFDPILQSDYYRIASFFWAGPIGQANQGGPTKEQLGFDVYGWTDLSPTPKPIRLLQQGERHKPGAEITPGFLSAVAALDKPLTPPPADSKTTHRRLQFARWITDAKNPLTARVLVNRVWQHHFGQGLVRTPNNFGFKSDPPTHPKLLDWLAAEFMRPTVDDGPAWTIKRLHKLIMTSETYQQASVHANEAEYAAMDFTNRNWWKFPRRRLDSESLRDAMLQASGQLNLKMGGPSFYPRMTREALEGLSRKSGDWQESSANERARRSVYMMTKRSRLLPLMTTFDFRDTTVTCGQRDVTTVAPQALALLNNQFVHAQSEALAKRLATHTADREKQIQLAWNLAFNRHPTPTELGQALEHLHRQQAHFDPRQNSQGQPAPPRNPGSLVGLELWLRADTGFQKDTEDRVKSWSGRSPKRFTAQQATPGKQPIWVKDAAGGHPALRFDGLNDALVIPEQVLHSQHFTIIAVANHTAKNGLREIFSNWGEGGGSGTSLFIGTNGATQIRLTDAFSTAGHLSNPQSHFGLMAINSGDGAATFQNGRPLASTASLPARKLLQPYTIGTQGTINGEYWQGDIAELIVINRALNQTEQAGVWRYLAERYGFVTESDPINDPVHLALASLCHVLLNANEFVYLD